MKAFILAAGKGTRLKPYTDTCPKCLMDINGTPLLEIWLRNLEKTAIEEVLVNTHYLSQKVEDFVSKRQKTGLAIKLFHEEELLGSGGTIKANKEFVKDQENFLIIYADNLTNTDLNELIEFHKNKKDSKPALTMALFETSRPQECGIASVDKHGKIISFVEKPENPDSNLANAGIYICNKKIFDFLDKIEKPFFDIGFDLLPLLSHQMYGMPLNGFIKDIGSVKNYHDSIKKWKELSL